MKGGFILRKKILLITIILICATIVTILFILQNNKLSNSQNTKTNTSENTTNIIFGLYNNETPAPTINVNGENAGVYIGQSNNYTYFSMKINKESSTEAQVKALIKGIADTIGYTIEINSIEVNDLKIQIDFSDSAAPFEINNSYLGGGEKYHIVGSQNGIANIVFSSIHKTLFNYFGTGTEVYLSMNSKNIFLSESNTTIDMNVPYEPTN